MELEQDALYLTRSILKRHEDLRGGGKKDSGNCQRRPRIEKTAAMKQTLILNHFKQM